MRFFISSSPLDCARRAKVSPGERPLFLHALFPSLARGRVGADGHVVLLNLTGRAAAIAFVFFEERFQLTDDLRMLGVVIAAFGKVLAQVEEFAQSYEDPQQVLKYYFSDRQRLAEVEALVLEENVVNYVLAKAKVTEKSVAFDELMGNNAQA